MSPEQRELNRTVAGKVVAFLKFRQQYDHGARCHAPELVGIHFSDGTHIELNESASVVLFDGPCAVPPKTKYDFLLAGNQPANIARHVVSEAIKAGKSWKLSEIVAAVQCELATRITVTNQDYDRARRTT